MKKAFCAIIAMVICIAMAVPAFAAEGEFVPSISYKNALEVVGAKMGNEDVGSCIIVSSILDAKNKSTDIHQNSRDLLLDVYAKLSNGTMSLPLEKDYVILDLVDVSYKQKACIEVPHGHEEELNKDNTSVSVTFRTKIGASTKLIVMQYKGGEWRTVESKNNGNGTVTCVFEDFCPVAFAVEEANNVVSLNPKTGDNAGQSMGMWLGLVIASAAAMAVTVLNRRKIFG